MAIEPVPRISVVIFTYNSAKYLRECIESILAQTLRPFEIIICDDHSMDESWAIVREYRQRYSDLIKPFRHKRNIGQVHNGNFGRKVAKGDLVTFLDSDDRWLPRKLELELKALQRHANAQIAYSNVYIIDAEGNRTGIWYDGKGSPPPSGDVFIEVFSRRFFPNTTSVFRNQLMYRFTLDEIGYNDENLDSYWDWDEKIRLTARFPVVYSGEALVEYRKHKEAFSSREPEKHFGAMVKVYEKHLPLLKQRSRKEACWVRCNIESLLALLQVNLSLPERVSYYSACDAYERNRKLLDRLPEHDRAALEKKLATALVSLAWLAAKEEIARGNIRSVHKYLLELLRHNPKSLNLKLVAPIMLPRWAYISIKTAYRGLRDARQRYLGR